MDGGYHDIAWDELYSTGQHRGNWDRPAPAPELVEFIDGRDWPAGCQILDLGCGTGSDAVSLAERGFSVSAVDISDVAIREARERHPDAAVEWICADVCALPIEDSTQDLVVDGACLHHFTRRQWDDYSREVARILKPGGILFVRGVSSLHRSTHILDRSWITDVFSRDPFAVELIIEFPLVGASGRQAPGLAAVVIRT